MVSNNAIASIIFGMIFCFVFPTAILIYFKKKEHFKMKPVLMGSLVFIVFALILEQMFHKFVITSKIISVNTIGFAVYAALAAGVFEETGRFVAFKMFLKKNTEWK
ncbi:MAG: YhfC family glutamic-type intramembrane protease, partial [Clostridiaceae bacterium]